MQSNHAFAHRSEEGPALRLYTESEKADDELTVRTCYLRYILPEIANKTKTSTQNDNMCYVDYWERFETHWLDAHPPQATQRNGLPPQVGEQRIDYPLLSPNRGESSERPKIPSAEASGTLVSEIRTAQVSAFRDWIVLPKEHGGLGLSNSRSTKAVQLIKRVVEAASEDVQVRTIRTKTLQTKAAPKHFPSADDVSRLWEAAPAQVWPNRYEIRTFAGTGLSPCDWWRSLLVILSSYGMRVQDLALYSSRDVGEHYSARRALPVCWADISFSPRSPNPYGRIENRLGWFTFIASKTGQEFSLPMTEPIRATIDRLAIAAAEATGRDPNPRSLPQDRPILPTPNSRRMGEHWRLLQARARVCSPIEKPFILEDFRKHASSRLLVLHDALPYAVCGWDKPKSGCAQKHYLESEELLVEYLPKDRYPDCFREWID